MRTAAAESSTATESAAAAETATAAPLREQRLRRDSQHHRCTEQRFQIEFHRFDPPGFVRAAATSAIAIFL
jgi:hypothetical protein